MKTSIRALAGAALVAMAMLASQASAALLNFSLSQPTQTGSPGSTLSFTATVSAPSANLSAVFLNGDSSNADFPLSVNDSGFFNNFPLSLDPGQSFTGTLFTVGIPVTAQSGLVLTGIFQIEGGFTADASDVIASANFTVDTPSTTTPPASPVPEPGTFGLAGAGLLGGLLVWRRRSQLKQKSA